jgi:hypothetical protein
MGYKGVGMDAVGERIGELVVEACGLVCQAEGLHPARDMGRELEYLRGLLVVLSCETEDAQAADAAGGVVAEIDRALAVLDGRFADRAA